MKSILIAEDEPRIASFVAKGLQKNGFKAVVASDGEQAVLMIQEQEFDLLLLDLGLPIKDGWTVLNELKEQGCQMPVIIVTAWDGIKNNQEGYDYVTKPFRFQDLLKLVYHYVNQ